MSNEFEHKLVQRGLESIGGERGLAWMKYRWEFLRRNPEYVQAYKDLLETEEEEVLVAQEFGLPLGMIDPNLSFENLLNSASDMTPELDPKVHLRLIAEHLGYTYPFTDFSAYNDSEPVIFPERDRFNRLEIGIDFDLVNSITDLKKSIETMIDFYWRAYRKKAKKTTRSLIDYDLILMVGDLKERENLTNKEVARILFPRDFDPDNENARPESKGKLAGNYYKQYQELVEVAIRISRAF